jgi:hypothetical protein
MNFELAAGFELLMIGSQFSTLWMNENESEHYFGELAGHLTESS